MSKRFKLIARITTDNPNAVRSILQEFIRTNHGSMQEENMEFQVEAGLEGETAKELNRTLLSSLRKVAKRTRLRAQWQHGNEVEHFFDYVLSWTLNIKWYKPASR